MSNILAGLNPAQRAAVENVAGPVMIVAGAGSGKTRVLTHRIALLLEQGVRPWDIRALKSANAMDFDDLLIKTIELFDKNKEVLHYYQHKFQYILVDEYQDTNRAQYAIIKRLAGHHKNLTVVGDDAQSIYAFRGAD